MKKVIDQRGVSGDLLQFRLLFHGFADGGIAPVFARDGAHFARRNETDDDAGP